MLAGVVEKERSGRRGGEWVTNRLERDRAKIAAYEDLCRRIGWSFSVHRTDESPTRVLLNLHALISGEAAR